MCFVSWVQKTCKRHFNRVWYLSDFQLMALVIHLSLEILIEQGDVGLGGQFLNDGSPFLLISIKALHWYRTHFDLPPLISMFEMIIISVFKYYYFTLWYNCEKNPDIHRWGPAKSMCWSASPSWRFEKGCDHRTHQRFAAVLQFNIFILSHNL